MVSDGSDCTTFELLSFLSRANGGLVIGFPFSSMLIRLVAGILSLDNEYDKIFRNLRVDISSTTERVGWSPEHDTKQGITRLVSELKEQSGKKIN